MRLIARPFRKIPRDRARALILADYDCSPMTRTETLMESLNCRLKGATVEEFTTERDAALKCSHGRD